MITIISILLQYGLAITTTVDYKQHTEMKSVSKNGMNLKWRHTNGRIFFEMDAPTKGWLAIGFNNSKSISGTYLLMGHIVNNTPSVVEYYTHQPGFYEPLINMGIDDCVENIEGSEGNNYTRLKFSLPVQPESKYARKLNEGAVFILLLAYSQEDDFQHHSIMRTSINIKL